MWIEHFCQHFLSFPQAHECWRERGANAQQQPQLSLGDDVTDWSQCGPDAATVHAADAGRGARRPPTDAAENITYGGADRWQCRWLRPRTLLIVRLTCDVVRRAGESTTSTLKCREDIRSDAALQSVMEQLKQN